jgi:hypothetical protein
MTLMDMTLMDMTLMDSAPERISLSRIPHVWRAESLALAHSGIIATGHEALDVALGGG